MTIRGYPSEFLGRCAFCLDNAMLNTDCGKYDRWGAELSSRDCLAMRERESCARAALEPKEKGE